MIQAFCARKNIPMYVRYPILFRMVHIQMSFPKEGPLKCHHKSVLQEVRKDRHILFQLFGLCYDFFKQFFLWQS